MKNLISRRHILRGAGVALTLPWLESLAPRNVRAQAATAKRAVFTYFPHGAPNRWSDTTGTGSGAAWQLAPLQAAFEPLKAKLLMMRMLGNFTWRKDLLDDPLWDQTRTRMDFCPGCVMPNGAYILPSHSRDPGGFLNCVDGDDWRVQNGDDRDNSPRNPQTVDQLIARSGAATTHLQSLQVGLFHGDGELDQRHGNLSREMSFDPDGNVMNKQIDPRSVFDDIIGDPTAGGDEEAARRRALDLSALDAVAQSAATLQSRLGASDKAKLDQFLTGKSELEKKVMAVANTTCGDSAMRPVPGLLIPGEVGYVNGGPEVTQANMWLRAQTMNDLIVMALECDATRIITYKLDNSRSNLNYSWLTTDGGAQVAGYHDETHVSSMNPPASPPGWEAIMRWQAEVIADLATKMDAVMEGDKTLLDNSLLICGSDEHHADHAAFDLPMMVFGSGGGVLKQDEHVTFSNEISQMRQLRDFYYTVLQEYFGMQVASFGEDMREVAGMPNALMPEILA